MNHIAVHVALAFGGYAAFLWAGVSGIAYLLQEHQLKAKDPACLARSGVSLETLDRTNLRSLWIGFTLFTLGVVNGLWLARGRIGPTDAKTVFTLVIWAAYAALLGIRTTALSRGPKVATMSILCLLLIGFTLIGVRHFGTQHVFF